MISLRLIKVKDYDEMSAKACEIFVKKMNEIENPVFGLATGSTPEGLYQKLIEEYQKGNISFKHVTTFNLDEYIGLPPEHPQSYHYFMGERLFNHIDIPRENAYLPNGVAEDLEKECERYEQLIRDAGGIDLQLLGLGNNAHIGFNEPGTPFDSRTAVNVLADSTRENNARFFDSKDDVPTTAISMGIGTIMEAREILLIVSGEHKADILAKVLHIEEVSEDFPASVLHQHDHVTIIADEAALSKVDSI